jgi:hypothetical protein
MHKYFFLLMFAAISVAGHAQETDSVFAVRKGNRFAIKHIVKPRENVKMLAHRFFVSENVLEYTNEYQDMRKLTPGTAVYIPVTKENYFIVKPTLGQDTKELYYKVAVKDEIAVLSTYVGITKNEFRAWNNLKGNTLVPDETLFIGWVKMVIKDTTDPDYELSYPAEKKKKVVVNDTVKTAVPGGIDSTYNRQTMNGSNVLTEKGSAVFFEKAGKNDVFYAFHNGTPRGTVIKVYNPGNNHVTYVKILGPLPNTKLYSGALIGISSAAKEALGVVEDKAWLELSYSTN